jgi:hypothetical protein
MQEPSGDDRHLCCICHRATIPACRLVCDECLDEERDWEFEAMLLDWHSSDHQAEVEAAKARQRGERTC